MIHHITLSQLRTFTPPATQFGADNEPYMVIQVNRDPMDFQQLTSFLYEFAYPIPASREDLLMISAYLSNINNGSREGFSSSHPRLLLISKLSDQSFIISTLPLIRLMLSRTILIPTWSTVPPAFSSLNVPAKKNGPFIM